MSPRLTRSIALLVLLIATGWTNETDFVPLTVTSDSGSHKRDTNRVNAPYFDGDVRFSETAIFWFGRVTPTENSVDVRVGYNDDHLYLRVAAFDRRLWYDTSPSLDDLIAWDAVTVYLDLDGNVEDAPDANSYYFDAQLVWWETRDNYQAAYQGDGTDWVQAYVPFTTTSGWRGYEPNSEEDDRGWTMVYYIPFKSMGLSAPPAQDTVWGLAVSLHDRDDVAGTRIPDQVWPKTMVPELSTTWGELVFGLPTYDPLPAISEGSITIRHGQDSATVVDADVGGSSVCGQSAAPDYFSNWGDLNYAGKEFLNIQNQGDVADWPCYSRYYVTFPLEAIPPGKVILSATLQLHQFGNAGEGWDPGPKPSLIQIFTIGDDWNESTITWNNAPLAKENIEGTWVDPVDSYPGMPGIPWEWNVTQAAAEAYISGEPLRLALYESDWAYHSGKYFHTSDACDWNPEGCPALTVVWGRALAELDKTAIPPVGDHGEPITYTLNFLGSGHTLTLTDTLPSDVSVPDSFTLEGTSVTPAYDSDLHRLMWSDTPAVGQEVTIFYPVTITTSDPQALVNIAELSEAGGETNTATTMIIANPFLTHLPLIRKDD